MAPPIGFVSTREDAAARVAYLFSETVLSVQPNLKAAPVVGFQHALDRMVYDKVRGIVAKRGTLPSELGKTTFVSITAVSSTLPAAIRTGKGVIHFFHQPEGNALVYGGTEGSTVANKVYWNDTAGVVAEKPAMEEAAKENANGEHYLTLGILYLLCRHSLRGGHRLKEQC
ncbi:hypothetical protein V1504DRAFT_337470 [Lipomyces starkeyi]